MSSRKMILVAAVLAVAAMAAPAMAWGRPHGHYRPVYHRPVVHYRSYYRPVYHVPIYRPIYTVPVYQTPVVYTQPQQVVVQAQPVVVPAPVPVFGYVVGQYLGQNAQGKWDYDIPLPNGWEVEVEGGYVHEIDD